MQRLKGKWQKSKRERLFDITMPVIYLSEDAADTGKNISTAAVCAIVVAQGGEKRCRTGFLT